MQVMITRGGRAQGGWLGGAQRRQRKLTKRLGLASVAMALSVVALSVVVHVPRLVTAAHAQSGEVRGREVLLGTIETRTRPDPDRGAAAARMLDDAMRALDSGEVMLGRRRLEVLVQHYPDTLAAEAARQELGRFDHDRRAVSSRHSDEGDARRLPETRSPAAAENGRFGYGAPRDPARLEPQPRTGPAAGAASALAAPIDVPAPRTDSPNRRQRLQDERRLQALARDFQATAGDRVFFGETDVDLGSRARAVLVAQARWLAAHPELPVTIEAHADEQGSPAFNVSVAERRGRAVRDRLIAEGVAADRIVVRAYGRERPIATCQAPECAAQNRRVVTQIGELPPDGADDRSGPARSPTVDGGGALEPRAGRD